MIGSRLSRLKKSVFLYVKELAYLQDHFDHVIDVVVVVDQ